MGTIHADHPKTTPQLEVVSANARPGSRQNKRLTHDFRDVPAYANYAELPGWLQTKREVCSTKDSYEQEANRVAEQVMQAPERQAQDSDPRSEHCAISQEHAGDSDRISAMNVGKVAPSTIAPPPIISEVLHSPGEPLSEATRHFMEARFGRDFGGVRVHNDAQAALSARSINARAYTVGRDIAFATGQYAPNTADGAKLIAHELAHVVQQRSHDTLTSASPGIIQRQESPAEPLPVIRSYVLKPPPTFRQNDLTCWAASIASWLLVKGIVMQGFSDQYLINYYKGTSCVDEGGALTGASAIKDVFAEWRLAIDLGAEVQQDKYDATAAEKTLRRHGHFILVTGDTTLHAIVVYGVKVHSADDPLQYSLLVMDPIHGVTEMLHHMFLDYPIRVAVGLPKRAALAPCRSRGGDE